MFSGIVQGVGSVQSVDAKKGVFSLLVDVGSELSQDVKNGASVSVGGVCLTVVEHVGSVLSFDVSQETLDKTYLGQLSVGDRVNIERSVRVGDEIGGHVVSGHVYGVGEIVEKDTEEENVVMTFRVPKGTIKYLFHKGFVALDGASLTVLEPDEKTGTFSVALIPETLRMTTFGDKQVGDKVHVEFEASTQAVVDTVERIMSKKK